MCHTKADGRYRDLLGPDSILETVEVNEANEIKDDVPVQVIKNVIKDTRSLFS